MLVIDQIHLTYPNGVQALKGVRLNIPNGLFGLLGPNGAGKSTLMRILSSLQVPDQGKVLFRGKDIFKDVQSYRRKLGYLPQYFGVYPRINAYDLLDHLAKLKGLTQKSVRKGAVEELLHHTNLFQHRKKAVSSFSGGMRQRFGIAQALLGDPDLIIVDEPTSGLDPEERNRFHNLLALLAEKKVVLFSTHIVSDVAELCTRMAILGEGSILEQGNPKELCQNLEGRIWRREIQPEALTELEQSLDILSQRWVGGKRIVHVLSSSPPPGFEPTQPQLEDVFFSALRPTVAQA